LPKNKYYIASRGTRFWESDGSTAQGNPIGLTACMLLLEYFDLCIGPNPSANSPANGLGWNEFNELSFDMYCVWVNSNGLY